MIVCGNCGGENQESDPFCGTCGQFLEWVGTKADEQAAAAAEAEAQRKADEQAAAAEVEAEAQRKNPPPRRGGPSKSAAITIAAASAADTIAAEGQETPETEAATAGSTDPEPSAEGLDGQPTSVQPVARRPTAVTMAAVSQAEGPDAAQPPSRTTVTQPDQPVARLPTADRPVEARSRTSATHQRRAPEPGDRICAACGEANDPARKFCRRCGDGLLEASIVAAPAPLPWWKRLFRRKPKQFVAGERTSTMQAGSAGRKSTGMGRIRLRQAVEWVLGLLVLLGVVGYLALPGMQQIINRAVSVGVDAIQRTVNPRLEPIRPVEVVTADAIEDHPVSNLFDKYANTDWRASSDQPTVTTRFDETFDLGALIVHSGAAEDFTETRRPAKIKLTFPDGSSTVLDLKDDNAKQTITVEKSGIGGFELRIVETYGPADLPVTISELEVFARR